MVSARTQVHLLVDVYNVIGAWPQLTRTRDQESLEMARHHLVEALANYSAYQDWRTNLVFDAYAQNTPVAKELITAHLSVHYTEFGQTADSYIEKWCALRRPQVLASQQRLIVATSDRAQRLTVTGYGAEWMSAQQLAQEVITTQARDRRHRQRPQATPQRFLASSLAPETQERLKKLRFGLKD